MFHRKKIGSEGMKEFIARHEKWIDDVESRGVPWEQWGEIHRGRLEDLRHERLIHLIVTFSFASFAILSLALWLFFADRSLFALFALFLLLTSFYVKHYWMLENTAQRWMRWGAAADARRIF